MYRLDYIKKKSLKKNQKDFQNNFYFSSKFSIYFTYIFVNLKISPNQVTFIFFLFGFLGAILLYFNTAFSIILSFIFYRLHVIIDLCDGEVARFTKLYSLNGTYYDYMIHSVLYPFWFASMGIAQYFYWENDCFLIIGIIGAILSSLTLAVKNNYFRSPRIRG